MSFFVSCRCSHCHYPWNSIDYRGHYSHGGTVDTQKVSLAITIDANLKNSMFQSIINPFLSGGCISAEQRGHK